MAQTQVPISAPNTRFTLCVPDGADPNLGAYRRGQLPHDVMPLLHALFETTQPGGRVLDVGGYIGGFGLAAASAGYEVVIVEANPSNAALIQQSIALNTFARPVRVLQCAVGETAQASVSFFSSGPWGHISNDRSNDPTTDGVPQWSLPDIIQQTGWPCPEFIKLDVEGSEMNALKGAKSWLALGNRPTVAYEANAFTLSWFGATPEEMNRVFDNLSYHRYELEDAGTLRQPALFEPRCVVDYLVTTTPLSGVQPAHNWWKLLKMTVRACQNTSPQARAYTQQLVMQKLGLGMFVRPSQKGMS